MPKRIAAWNPTRGIWEDPNGAADLLSEHSEPYWETWPTSGMTRDGQAFEQPTPAPRTADSASSSSPTLPTPVVTDSRAGGNRADPGDNSLTDVLVRGRGLLPTPDASSATRGIGTDPTARRAAGHSVSLEDVVAHLPEPDPEPSRITLLGTPRAADGMGHPLRTGLPAEATKARLEDQIALLPTPTVVDMGANKSEPECVDWTRRMKARHGNGAGHGASLSIEARRIAGGPTPQPSPAGSE